MFNRVPVRPALSSLMGASASLMRNQSNHSMAPFFGVQVRNGSSYSSIASPNFEAMEVYGFPKFLAILKTLQSRPPGEPAFVLFCGNPSGGTYSWCPDCVRTEPSIEQMLQVNAPLRTMLCHARVGTRDEFKGVGRGANMFVQHPEYQVTEVPTFMHVGSRRFLRGPYEVGNHALLEEFVKSSVAMDSGSQF